jgi:hypothetical protein
VNLRTRLNQTRKENKTGVIYFGQIKSLADEMATTGKPLDNDDIISYVLAGLDEEYDEFFASVNALLKAQKSISMSNFYSMFLACEAQINNRNPSGGSFANAAT